MPLQPLRCDNASLPKTRSSQEENQPCGEFASLIPALHGSVLFDVFRVFRVFRVFTVFGAFCLVSGCSESGSLRTAGDGASWFVRAGEPGEGDGSAGSPFGSLAEAEAASADGDVIYLVASFELLDGGIAMKPGQKLIGVRFVNQDAAVEGPVVSLTNSTENLAGVIVRLSERNEVAGIRFVDLQNHAIEGVGVDLSGTHLHHNSFTGAALSDDIIWSIRLEAEVGEITDARVTDSTFRDGEWLGGIQVVTRGNSSADYQFERNQFSDLGGRAYHLWSRDQSRIQARILDSSADNIGLGDKNSDSILPHLWDSSEQTVLVRNYRYQNSKQVGNQSNCGIEAFLMGPPFPGPEGYCDGCKLKLVIEDSDFENPVTDGIQLINFGSNSILEVEIRNTRIVDAQPKQVGGGLSLLAQNADNTGSRTSLLVENSDIIGSSGYGFAVSDQGEGHTAVIDLGGGELGSAGNNRFVGSATGEVQLINSVAVAKNNWWGGEAPRIDGEGDGSKLESDPVLEVDPRPNS